MKKVLKGMSHGWQRGRQESRQCGGQCGGQAQGRARAAWRLGEGGAQRRMLRKHVFWWGVALGIDPRAIKL